MPCATRARIKLLLVCVLASLLISEATNADIYKTIIDPKAKEFGNKVCTNKECTQHAARFLLHRDETANPCEDFVKYTCGNFKMYNEKEVSKNLFNPIDKRIKKLLTEPSSPNEKSYITLAKLFYQKCVDKTSLKASRKAAMVPLLDEIGGWPLLNPQWTEFTSSWEEYIAAIHQKYQIPILFETKQFLSATETDTWYYLQLVPTVKKLNPKLLKALALELGAQNPSLESEIDTFMTQINAEAEKLYQQHSNSDMMSEYYKDVKGKFNNFDLQKYINRLYQGVAPVNTSMVLIVHNVDYFNNIHSLFKNKRIFANYAASIVATHLIMLDKPPEPEDFALSPDSQCVVLVLKKLSVYPVAQMYVEKYFNLDDVAPEIIEMLKVLSEELKNVLNKATWLDDTTRRNALEKLSHMTNKIGYPKNLFNDTYIEENWLIPFDPSDSFYTLAARMDGKLFATETLLQTDRPFDPEYWLISPLIPNAAYNRLANEIVVCLGILQPPFYNKNVPKYINYAAIGMALGHEILHGYDDKGRQHDKFGHLKDWWKPETSQKYDDKSKCFVNQFTDAGFDGQLSLGENIADNEGLKIAYKVYKKVVANLPEPEHALPGFEEFTIDQMFFVTLANNWCDIENSVRADANDPHPPSSLRIRMMMRNMKEFSEAFNCPKQANMNPDDKCIIW